MPYCEALGGCSAIKAGDATIFNKLTAGCHIVCASVFLFISTQPHRSRYCDCNRNISRPEQVVVVAAAAAATAATATSASAVACALP